MSIPTKDSPKSPREHELNTRVDPDHPFFMAAGMTQMAQAMMWAEHYTGRSVQDLGQEMVGIWRAKTTPAPLQ